MTKAVRDRILKDVNGDISDHIRNHIHLTNCIHLKNHMHKHSPILTDRALMRDLVALQRSRSLRDPSASPPSVVDVVLRKGETDELVSERRSVERPRHRRQKSGAFQLKALSGQVSRHRDCGAAAANGRVGYDSGSSELGDKNLNTLSDQLKGISAESDAAASSHDSGNGMHEQIERNSKERLYIRHGSRTRGRRRRVRDARRNLSARAIREAEAQNEMSVASNSFAQGKAPQKYYMEEGFQDHDGQNVGGAPRNGCGIPWNWSRIHHRGKSFLDMAGRSLSCGLSESRFKKGCSNAQGMDTPGMPVMSEFSSSSTKSNGEAMPLLLEASTSQGSVDRASWHHDYSGELGIYADNLLKQETDSDLASEGRSHLQLKFLNHRNGRHQSLTQKYMPQTFRDLVGQNLVVQALSNAITKRKVGLLYLFYGPHGTGKTSCARLFARALNCQSLEHPKPCGNCNSCIAQSTGKSRNIREIGPVSNIDFASIIEQLDNLVAYARHSQYRVYIFDECDTLSSECWSMMLKVIDRAPRHVVFVLVCSSLEALPHVLISRCHKFFFPKLKDADIIYTLQWIASKEDLAIDKDALKLIASRSDGSLRDAEMTMEQLSLLGKEVSLGLVQELIGLISDEKLVDLLDLALSADTVNTVKNLRDIMESGVEPLALMSQLATVITDILAGSYDFTKERPIRKFFWRQTLSKKDMEKLRLALKTLSEAEKQLRVSSDRITWLTAALLQLAPDQQYMLRSSSAGTSSDHSPLVFNNASLRDRHRKSNGEMPNHLAGSSENVHPNGTGLDGNKYDVDGVVSEQMYIVPKYKNQMNEFQVQGLTHRGIEEIWFRVLEKIPTNSLKDFMFREGNLISVSYGAAPTVQLLFNSHPTKSKAERFRLQLLQAFESVLRTPVSIEIRCESKKDAGSGPILLPLTQDLSQLDTVNTRNNGMPMNGHDDTIRREIVEIEASPREYGARGKNSITDSNTQKLSNDKNRNLSLVRSKVSLAQVILQHTEGYSHHRSWLQGKAVSIAEKIEQENLRLESRSRRLLCWNNPKATHRKLSRLKIRTRKPRTLLKFVSCGRCLSGRSPRQC